MLSVTYPSGEQSWHTYEELIAQSPYTILYFYPKDNTPGCTLEANDFTSLVPEFKKLGVAIIGVSKDPHKSHCSFMSKHHLEINLISDEDYVLHKQFDVLGQKNMYGKIYTGTIRSTFLVTSKGDIVAQRRNVSASGHAKKVLEKAKEVVMHK